MGDESTSSGDGSLSTDELRGLIGDELNAKLDERGITKDVISKLDILGGIEGLFEKHKSSGIDKEGLLSEVGKLIDDKLSGLKGTGSNGGTGGEKTKREPKLRIFG